jgi:hypothetical protein
MRSAGSSGSGVFLYILFTQKLLVAKDRNRHVAILS